VRLSDVAMSPVGEFFGLDPLHLEHLDRSNWCYDNEAFVVWLMSEWHNALRAPELSEWIYFVGSYRASSIIVDCHAADATIQSNPIQSNPIQASKQTIY